MKSKFALSGNALKLIAAALMLVDHIGLFFFPSALWLRAIGRLSFPIFAFFIAEGCRHTRNRLRYFLTMAIFAAGCQIVYGIFAKSTDMSVFVTFTVSVLFTYTLYGIKDLIFAEARTRVEILRAFLLLLASAAVTVTVLVLKIDLDYGLTGAILPLFAAITHPPKNAPQYWSKVDTPPVVLSLFAVGMIIIAIDNLAIQYFSLLSLPLLALYSGERGKLRMKYFFYVFYPAHLVILWCIFYIISTIQ